MADQSCCSLGHMTETHYRFSGRKEKKNKTKQHFSLPSVYQVANRGRVSEHQRRRVSTDGLCRPLLHAHPPAALYGGDTPGRLRHASQSPGSQSRASPVGGRKGGCWQLLSAYCVPVAGDLTHNSNSRRQILFP